MFNLFKKDIIILCTTYLLDSDVIY